MPSRARIGSDLVQTINADTSAPANTINISANGQISVNNNILPAANVTYDLGTSVLRWRDLYLSGSTIKLGNTTISTSGNTLQLPAGTQLNGSTISTGGAGGAWTFINSTTVSGTVSSIDITSGIDGTYDMYVLELIKVEPDTTGGRFMYLRTSTDGGSTFDSSGYSYGSGTITDAAAGVDINASTSDSFIRLSDAGLGNNAGEYLAGFIYLVKPSAAANFVCFWDLAGLTYPTSKALRVFGSGQRETAADVDAIRIYMSSGNIVGGTVRLYGIVNS